jgi:poly(A) polymerase
MFTGPGRGRALRLLVELQLADAVLPEVVPMDGVPQPPQFHPEGDVLTHVCLVLDAVAEGDPVQAWAAVLHDVGKPPTFERAADRIRFSGHDQLSAQMAAAALERLRAPRALAAAVVDLCRHHIRFASLPQMSRAKRERWLRSAGFPAHLEFHRADCTGSHGDLSVYEAAKRLLAELPPEPPAGLCRGADVIALGVPEGPAVGEVLREVQRRLDELERPDREAALALLETIVRARVKAPSGGVD